MSRDSVIALYQKYDQQTFYRQFGPDLRYLSRLIDSLNGTSPPGVRVDTLSLDHSFQNIGNAACSGRTLYLSSSYFYLYNDRSVLKSVVMHEFGHLRYNVLPDSLKREVERIWRSLMDAALSYVFHDGEYSGNAWFGGHPEESPSELFASAFNILHNRPDELRARLGFVDKRHYDLVEQLREVIGMSRPVTTE